MVPIRQIQWTNVNFNERAELSSTPITLYTKYDRTLLHNVAVQTRGGVTGSVCYQQKHKSAAEVLSFQNACETCKI